MALPCAFLVALVVLSCSSLCCLGCDLPDNHGLLSWRTLMLLGRMKTLSASSCDNYTKDFRFPQDVFEGKQLQEAQSLSVIHVMNQQIFYLFCTEATSAPWNRTLLEESCSRIYEQLSGMESCTLQ